jgi:hypothetical protein
MLSIVSITPPVVVPADPLCLFASIKVFSNFGALEERSYQIWPQVLKTLREERMQSGSYARAMRGSKCFSA